MTRIRYAIAAPLALGFVLAATSPWAQERGHEEHPVEHRPEARPAEPHPGPRGYERVTEPRGWDARPAAPDRAAYQHNFQAARVYHVGPYRRPPGWVDRRWGYGQILPRAFWAPQYILADYWLFGLEIPPAGYEWVRVGNDAMLVNIANGEILQAEYGVFG
jgi:Ni/Co efflux regulator RcnB